MPIRSVTLTEHLNDFIDTSVARGRFTDASEAIRAGLDMLERECAEDTANILSLRQAAQEGIDAIARGEYMTLSSREEINVLVRSMGSARR